MNIEKLSESQNLFWTCTVRDFSILAIIILAIVIYCWRSARKVRKAFRQIKFLVIFFGNKLSQEEFCNADLRKKALEDGIELIQTNYPDLCIITKLSAVCAISVKGVQDVVNELKCFLDLKGIGYQEDDPSNPPFRAAQKGEIK